MRWCTLFLLPTMVLAEDEMTFLTRYGYLSSSANAQMDEDLRNLAIRKFQRSYHLPITGELDRATISAMKQPRCGVADVPTRSRRKRNLPLKWNTPDITYGISEFGKNGLQPGTTELLFRKAFDEYERVTNLKFRRSRDPMIEVRFELGSHNCTSFGEGELAHAFKPFATSLGGDMHFNDRFKFTTEEHSSNQGVSLFAVAFHEVGHALGLDHNSYEKESIMYPADRWAHRELTPRDLYMLHSLYGAPDFSKNGTTRAPNRGPTARPRRPAAGPTVPSREDPREREGDDRVKYHVDTIRPHACRTTADAITTLRGDFYVFKDEWFWRMSRDGVILQPPSLIPLTFPNLPYPIDAAVEIEGDLWIFVGKSVYVMSVSRGFRMKHSPLKLTDLGIDKDVQRIDMAYKWHYFNPPAHYLWSGERYWRFNPRSRRVEATYPRPVYRSWKHVPPGAHTAFTMDEELFFVKDSEVYRMNTSDWRLPLSEGYPRPIVNFWSGCRDQRVQQRFNRSSKLTSTARLGTSCFIFVVVFIVFYIRS